MVCDGVQCECVRLCVCLWLCLCVHCVCEMFGHVHVFSSLVPECVCVGCVSGSLRLYCSIHGHVYVRLNDHGLSD